MTVDDVKEIIRYETDNESVDFMDSISVLGDSLEFLHIISRIEAASGKEIPNSVVANFETVGQLADWVAA